MIYFIVGFFFGGIIEMVLYSVVVSGRINNRIQNKQMIFELEQKEKELATYRCMYASSYDGFEETK